MEVHKVLRMYLKKKRETSPGFSIRALSKRLGVSASFLSRVFNGKKPVPPVLLPKLAKYLDIEPEFFTTHAQDKLQTNHPTDDWALTQKDVTQILRNWYYVPILDFLTLKNFNGSIEEISTRLGLTIETTKIALREMQSLDLIRFENGRYQKITSKLRITTSKSHATIRRFHDDMLTRAQMELRNSTRDEDFQRRLITGITVTATPEKIQEAKARLAELLHSLANELIAEPGTEVYHLSAQLIPLSK